MIRERAAVSARNRAGSWEVVSSVRSTQADVLAASVLLARECEALVRVEAARNEVNQYGGYTGMSPADFAARMAGRAERLGVERTQVVPGGDHLGPQVRRGESAAVAMCAARDTGPAYVRAGFRKIHLDCSEACAGDPPQEALPAEGAAQCAAQCEAAVPDPRVLADVIGTEVSRPGGALGDEQMLGPPRPQDALQVIELHREALPRHFRMHCG